jgi:hypothetical protein
MIFVLNFAHVSEGTVKDPRSVLRQKDLDIERVRKEIQALLTVIPLLADDQPSCDVSAVGFLRSTSGSSGQ